MSLTANKKLGLRHTLIMLGTSIFGLIFMIVYYSNSRGIVSRYLNFIWLAPLLMSIAYFVVCFLLEKDIGEWARLSLNAGIGTVMVYQALAGIYDIAQVRPQNSPDAAWAVLFHYLGVALVLLGIVIGTIYIIKNKENNN